MTTIILQCGKCRYGGENLEWVFPDDDMESTGVYICSQYPDGIPEFVENGEKVCPKYKEVKND